MLLVGKWLCTRLTGVGTGLDIPFVHGQPSLIAMVLIEHEENTADRLTFCSQTS